LFASDSRGEIFHPRWESGGEWFSKATQTRSMDFAITV
jgi:hypothetical protein